MGTDAVGIIGANQRPVTLGQIIFDAEARLEFEDAVIWCDRRLNLAGAHCSKISLAASVPTYRQCQGS